MKRFDLRCACLAAILGAILMLAHVAAAQAGISGPEALAIAKREVQRRGLYVDGMTAQWDADNSSWSRWVESENAATIAAQHSSCGYWAIFFGLPPEVKAPDAGREAPLGVVRGGSVYVLVDKCRSVILDVVPMR